MFLPISALASHISDNLVNVTFVEFANFQFGIFLDNQTQLQSSCNSVSNLS